MTQLRRCASAFRQPPVRQAAEMAERLGGYLVEIDERAVVVSGLSEPPRYLMQHTLGYQVHDAAKPHRYGHGRADIGWMAAPPKEPT